jgi:LPS sulfotransferase NodH
MRPHTSYFICCTPRTGSWLLAEALQFLGIAGKPGEFFDQEREREWFELLGVSSYTDFLDKVLEYGTTPNGVFGAKVHWVEFKCLPTRLKNFPSFSEMAIHEMISELFPNLHYIWLTRRDKVRQAISYYKANLTDNWFWIDGQEYFEIETPSYDFKTIDIMLKMLVKNDASWQQYFHESGIEPKIVVYEELEQAYDATIRKLLQDLHIPLPADLVIPKPRLKKQADQLTEEWVQRFHDFKEHSMRNEDIRCFPAVHT